MRIRSLAVLFLSLVFLAFSQDNTEVDQALDKVGYTYVDLKKDLTGAFVCDAEINGEKFKLILSEKMDRTILDVNKLEKYEIEYEETGQEYRFNSDDGELFIFTADEINVGGGRLGEQELYAVDFDDFIYLQKQRADGFLGLDFLLKHHALIDLANQKLYLKTE